MLKRKSAHRAAGKEASDQARKGKLEGGQVSMLTRLEEEKSPSLFNFELPKPLPKLTCDPTDALDTHTHMMWVR